MCNNIGSTFQFSLFIKLFVNPYFIVNLLQIFEFNHRPVYPGTGHRAYFSFFRNFQSVDHGIEEMDKNESIFSQKCSINGLLHS